MVLGSIGLFTLAGLLGSSVQELYGFLLLDFLQATPKTNMQQAKTITDFISYQINLKTLDQLNQPLEHRS